MNLKQAVNKIKAETGLDRKGIAKRLHINPSYLSSAIKKPTESIIENIKYEFRDVLGNTDITIVTVVKTPLRIAGIN